MKAAVGRGTSFVIGCGWLGRNTEEEPDKQLWQFRLRPLVLHSFSCGCPPQLYTVTVELAVATPASDLFALYDARVDEMVWTGLRWDLLVSVNLPAARF